MTRLVRLTLDQEKLSARYRIIPLDGEAIFAQTHNLKAYKDRSLNLPNHQLREEFLIGNIIPLHRYLIRIDIRKGNFGILRADDALILADLVPAYAEKYGIELHIDPYFTEWVEYIREVRREWDD